MFSSLKLASSASLMKKNKPFIKGLKKIVLRIDADERISRKLSISFILTVFLQRLSMNKGRLRPFC